MSQSDPGGLQDDLAQKPTKWKPLRGMLVNSPRGPVMYIDKLSRGTKGHKVQLKNGMLATTSEVSEI